MSKQICIVCGERRPNLDNGVRVIKLIGHTYPVIGFSHDGKCLVRTKPLHKRRQLTKDELNDLYGRIPL